MKSNIFNFLKNKKVRFIVEEVINGDLKYYIPYQITRSFLSKPLKERISLVDGTPMLIEPMTESYLSKESAMIRIKLFKEYISKQREKLIKNVVHEE